MYVDTLRIDFLARASCPGCMVSFWPVPPQQQCWTFEAKPAARGVAGTLIFAAGAYIHT